MPIQPVANIGKGIEKVKEIVHPAKTVGLVKGIIKKDKKEEEQIEEELSSIKLRYPNHLAMTMEGVLACVLKNGQDLKECYKKSFTILKNIIRIQTKHNITILTVLVLPASVKKNTENFSVLIDGLIDFFKETKEDPLIHKNKIKISVLGKWYDLPGRLVDPIKEVTNETKEYDHFFLNLCINYNGQEEIADAIRLIGRQIKAEKIDPGLIGKETVKENLYSSYFIPPDLIIKTGLKHTIPGVLLWDSIYSKLYFADKYWPDLKVSDLIKAFKEFQD